MDILRKGGAGLPRSTTLPVAQQLESSLDVDVAWVKLRRALIRIQRIIDLIVT
jgi:hypothetical protein